MKILDNKIKHMQCIYLRYDILRRKLENRLQMNTKTIQELEILIFRLDYVKDKQKTFSNFATPTELSGVEDKFKEAMEYRRKLQKRLEQVKIKHQYFLGLLQEYTKEKQNLFDNYHPLVEDYQRFYYAKTSAISARKNRFMQSHPVTEEGQRVYCATTVPANETLFLYHQLTPEESKKFQKIKMRYQSNMQQQLSRLG